MKSNLQPEKSFRWFIATISIMFIVIGGIGAIASTDASAATGSVFTVTTTADSGAGSFRWAIDQANSSAGHDTIKFDVTNCTITPITIKPLSALPPLSSELTIEGPNYHYCTAPFFHYNRSPIVLDGSGTIPTGLNLTANSITIRGLVIQNFPSYGIKIDTVQGALVAGNKIGPFSLLGGIGNGTGIYITKSIGVVVGGTAETDRNVVSGNSGTGIYISEGGGNKVEGNYIGTNTSGDGRLENRSGVGVFNSPNTIIQDNVISGQSVIGVDVRGPLSGGTKITGNHIGIDVTGTAIISNTYGVFLEGVTNITVGGSSTSQRNIISGNNEGFHIQNGSASTPVTNLSIIGNYIGTNFNGSVGLGNKTGIVISSGSFIDIGSASQGEGNLISGNQGTGIHLTNTSTHHINIMGNLIGTDSTGYFALGNGGHGIMLSRSPDITIGGATTSYAGNVISSNGLHGIFIDYSESTNATIRGNKIGTDIHGSGMLGNGGSGIYIDSADNTQIGGNNSYDSNLIAFNTASGIRAEWNIRTLVKRNAIHTNGDLGIDFDTKGVSPNDPLDEDWFRQNAPVLFGKEISGSDTIINGNLNSEPNQSYLIVFYGSKICDPSGYGEGEQFLKEIQVTTNAQGNASFSENLGSVDAGLSVITANAISNHASTSYKNDSSEFSNCVQSQIFLPLIINK